MFTCFLKYLKLAYLETSFSDHIIPVSFGGVRYDHIIQDLMDYFYCQR